MCNGNNDVNEFEYYVSADVSNDKQNRIVIEMYCKDNMVYGSTNNDADSKAIYIISDSYFGSVSDFGSSKCLAYAMGDMRSIFDVSDVILTEFAERLVEKNLDYDALQAENGDIIISLVDKEEIPIINIFEEESADRYSERTIEFELIIDKKGRLKNLSLEGIEDSEQQMKVEIEYKNINVPCIIDKPSYAKHITNISDIESTDYIYTYILPANMICDSVYYPTNVFAYNERPYGIVSRNIYYKNEWRMGNEGPIIID